jgi:hypothetical protein
MERAGRVISRTKLAGGAVSLEELACTGWPVAVGKKIAARTRAITLAGGRLRVDVEDAVWQRQLGVLKNQILARLEEILGTSVVRDVEFRVAPRRRLPQPAAEPHKERDEADQIQDPVLRAIYRQRRRRRSA